ncbi:MAG: phosphodiester glycosidase family protein [Acidobacteria bacterium]|nr:MAG: phosphodiester glycosidase family protein [Acidobacteriota bacterium]
MARGYRVGMLRALLVALACVTAPQSSWLSVGEPIAPGVEYYTSTDQSLVEPPGPTAVYLLKLDPKRVALDSVHAKDRIMGLETVDAIAASHKAIAAVNAGFFNTRNGDPATVLKISGELVSDATQTRGVVIINSPASGQTTLGFDQLGAKQELRFKAGGKDVVVPIDGVDTTRAIGKLMLYSPLYGPESDTAPTGTEWIVSGSPLRVQDVRSNAGHSLIPRDGFVLSFGGVELPVPLDQLRPRVQVSLRTNWVSLNGVSASELDAAEHIVNGAGLLRRQGRVLTDWTAESLSGPAFTETRHPRTLIGVDDKGFIWLAAIDGRQPDRAVGMNFAELQRLCDRLHLTDALNLDGGGSTSMVVKGEIRNKPSDATGPRPVSDALVVTIR